MSEIEFWKDIGNISEAILNYQKKNAEFNNRFINPWIRLGFLLDRGDHDEEMVRAHLHAIEIDPDTAQNWIDLADMQLKIGAYEEAEIAYRKAVELAPQAGWPLCNLALTLVKQGKCEESIPLYIASIELHTEAQDKVVSLNRLGDVYRKLNDYENAFLSFQKADELDGKNISLSNQPNEISQNTSMIAEEEIPDETITEQAQEYDDMDDDPLANFEKHLVQTTQPEVESSIAETASDNKYYEIHEESIDLVPNPEIQVEKIAAAETLDEAITKINETIPNWLSEEHKNNLATPVDEVKNTQIPEWLIINTKEITALETAEPVTSEENAAIIIDQLNGQNEADAAAKGSFADVSGKQSDQMAYEEYLKDVVEPMTILSDHMDEIHNQANISNASEMSIAMESKNAQVWNELGNMYLKSGSYDDAIASYSKAIELERHFAWPYSNLALAYVQKGYFAEAILLYQRSIELFSLDKDKAVTWNRLGNVYRRMNDYDNAIAAYQTADELDPENATLSLRSSFGLLGNLYAEQKPNYVY
jgi:tetratricopeptide (TPR) repeat protein